MSITSGQYGTVKNGSGTEITSIDGWTLNMKAAVHERAHNGSSGYKEAVAGVKSCSGTIKGPYEPSSGLPIDATLAPGTSITLQLYSSADQYHSVPAIISDLNVEVDLDEGEIISWDASFTGNGAWTVPT